jgi:cellulose biosynthesis protein BcsQ
MSFHTIAIFNPQEGVGKTSLVYHLAWMYQDLGLEVVVADLDPQAKLTAAFLKEDDLEERWLVTNTVSGSEPRFVEEIGEMMKAQEIEEQLTLLTGDMSLLAFEDELSKVWHLPDNEHTNDVLSAFWRHLQLAATVPAANIVLMDLGSNLGAINRAALIAADYVIVPLIPDLFSVLSLKHLGTALRQWREQWKRRRENNSSVKLPLGQMSALGYVIFQQPIKLYLGANSYPKWMRQIPKVYHQAILFESFEEKTFSLKDDPHCLQVFKTYYSLIPMAIDVRKPIFHLKPADGALGAYGQLVPTAYREYQQLAKNIAKRAGIVLPEY